MKRALLAAVMVVTMSVLPSFAQDASRNLKGTSGSGGTDAKQAPCMNCMKGKGVQATMGNPQHELAMAYHQNVMNFSRALERVAQQRDTVPADFARTAIAEMRRSTNDMEKYRAGAMASIPAEMRTPEMQKRMDEHLVTVKTHLRELEELAKSDRIPSREVLKHLQAINMGCGGMSCDLMHRRGMHGRGMYGGHRPGCGCGPGMPVHRQMMEQMTQKLKAEDAEMLQQVEKMKLAPKDKKLDLVSDIVARLVQQRAEMTNQMERMQKNMMEGMPHMHGQPPMMQDQGADDFDTEDMDME